MVAFNVKIVAGQGAAKKMKLEFLTDLTGYQQQVEEFRQEWIHECLLSIGLEEDLLAEYSQQDLFDFLIQSGIDINYYPSFGGTEILLDGELVGEWGGPEFEVQFDEYNKPYYKLTIEYWIKEEE